MPEVWRYDGNALRIGLLDGGNYVESMETAVIPILTADALSRFVELSGTATGLSFFEPSASGSVHGGNRPFGGEHG